MPSFRKKYNKKPRRKTYAQYKAKKLQRWKKKGMLPKARAHVPGTFQILNKYKPRSYYFEDGWSSSSTGLPPITNWTSIVTFSMANLDRYSTLKNMFRQYRVKFLKIRVSMLQIENTDGAQIPELYIRYNYDPDLAGGALNSVSMSRQQNMVFKRFLQGDGGGTDFEYSVKPAVMVAQKIYASSNFTSAPKFNQWCDFQTLGANEPEHYGMQMLIPYIPTGVNFTFKYTVGYECRDVL